MWSSTTATLAWLWDAWTRTATAPSTSRNSSARKDSPIALSALARAPACAVARARPPAAAPPPPAPPLHPPLPPPPPSPSPRCLCSGLTPFEGSCSPSSWRCGRCSRTPTSTTVAPSTSRSWRSDSVLCSRWISASPILLLLHLLGLTRLLSRSSLPSAALTRVSLFAFLLRSSRQDCFSRLGFFKYSPSLLRLFQAMFDYDHSGLIEFQGIIETDPRERER